MSKFESGNKCWDDEFNKQGEEETMSKLVLPPVPVGHLKLSQYRNLQKAIKKLTGYTITLSVVARKKGKKK